MRLLLIALVIAGCTDPISPRGETRDVPPPEVPFDSIAWNCQPVGPVVNGQVQVHCTGG